MPETRFLRQFWQQYGDLVQKPLGPLGDRPLSTKERSPTSGSERVAFLRMAMPSDLEW
ncbi:MAG TPA: hypothetical protein IGS52_25595 [Oscillatoriaceae cyanobacterium M33_DOE_052]|nr:hypothetical protein [Oscillatoriaceae cyanobacterium M33_DOE_052]